MFCRMVSSLQAEAIRCLGYYMKIALGFFVLPPVHLRVLTGTRSDIRKSDQMAFLSGANGRPHVFAPVHEQISHWTHSNRVTTSDRLASISVLRRDLLAQPRVACESCSSDLLRGIELRENSNKLGLTAHIRECVQVPERTLHVRSGRWLYCHEHERSANSS